MEVVIDDLLEVGAAILDSSENVERVLPFCPVSSDSNGNRSERRKYGRRAIE
jgi:hypothetical protein